jgi:anaerobic selenocysteine-containing dehydrogenase
MRYVQTVCPRDCYDTCFQKFLLDNDNRTIRVTGDEANPVTQGFLCPRGVADIKRAYSPERILYPHTRVGEKPNGPFKRISWEEALNVIVEKLTQIMNEHGSESILHLDYTGNMGLLTQDLAQRWFYALGLAQTDLSVCSKSGQEALALHYGLSYGVDPDELVNEKLTVYWGFNGAVSAPHLHALSLKSKRKGGLIVAVDPRRSETAKTADFWVQPKPGSDVALAYGVMKHLIDNDLVDLGFVQEYTHGFDELKHEVSKWNTELIEKYTGLKWDTVARLARLYAESKPSVTMIGFGMQKSLYGAESVRAISLIPALIGLHRGFYYSNSKGWNIDERYLTGESLTRKKAKVVSQVAVGKNLEKGEFKFVYVYNMNPAETLPNQTAVRNGLRRKDVFVTVHDTHWTGTAKNADLVLPAQTFLEKEDIVISYSHRHVRKSNRVIEPLGESRDELWVMAELTRRLGIKEGWVFEDAWKALEEALAKAFEDGSFMDLMAGKTLKLRVKPRDEYQTSSGKIEFFSAKAERMGFTPFPRQYPLPTGDGFVFLNNAVSKYTHTQFRDVYGHMPATVFINLEDAEDRGIHDDDVVELFNDFGSIKLKAVVSDAVSRGVLWSPRECRDVEGMPQNIVIPDVAQKLGGGSCYNSTVVRIRKGALL